MHLRRNLKNQPVLSNPFFTSKNRLFFATAKQTSFSNIMIYHSVVGTYNCFLVFP